MLTLTFPLDPDSPVPIFHQVAEAIRYRIATGKLQPGESLPSVRDAGEQLDAHYLTVRRAYEALREDGLVESRRGVGTRVVQRPPAESDGGSPSGLERFLEETLWRARSNFELDPADLARALRYHAGLEEPGSRRKREVVVVECNEPQAGDYAGQLEEGGGIEAATWLLSDEDEPPPGLLVGTYFHFDDLRDKWPHRAADMRFVAVSLDRELKHRLQRKIEAGHDRFVICETRESRAHNALADLNSLLGDAKVTLETMVVDCLELALGKAHPDPVLFSPRLWAELNEGQRRDGRSLLFRYVIEPGDIMRLRESFEGPWEKAANAG